MRRAYPRAVGPQTGIGVLILSIAMLGCAATSAEGHDKSIFRDTRGAMPDSQRSFVNPEDAPFVVLIKQPNASCTGNIVDPYAQIGLTALHCLLGDRAQVCFGAETNAAPCDYTAEISEVIEVGSFTNARDSEQLPYPPPATVTDSDQELDYAIFRYSFVGDAPPPETLRAIHFPVRTSVAEYLESQEDVYLVGYPGDRYAQGQLSMSRCTVRSDIEVDMSSSAFLIDSWESDPKYYQHPAYQQMREACTWVTSIPTFRPFFYADCSVYGGNSGGALVASNGLALGLPESYSPEPGDEEPLLCLDEKYGRRTYWDIFFKPLLPWFTRTWGTQGNRRWNRLDRNGDVYTFPEFVPLEIVAEHSPFLWAHPEYTDRATPSEESGK